MKTKPSSGSLGSICRSEGGAAIKASQNARSSEFSDLKRARMMRQVTEDARSKAGLFQKVYDGKASPRLAIKAKCLECCWMDEAGIRECSDSGCPLWDFRPYLREQAPL